MRFPIAVVLLAALTACNEEDPFPSWYFTDTSDADTSDADTSDTDASDADTSGTDTTDDSGTETDADTTDDTDGGEDTRPDVQPDTAPDTTPDTEPDGAPDTEPDSDTDSGVCTPGEACIGGDACIVDEAGCDAEPYCGFLCDAPTMLVCGCDGVVVSTVPSCSTVAYSYVLYEVDQRPDLIGAPCDPTTEGRLRYDLELEFVDFAGWSGETVRVLVPDNWSDGYVVDADVLVTGDTFEASFPFTLDTDLFGWTVYWYIDLGRDGACDPGFDPAWAAFVSNPFDSGPVSVIATGSRDAVDEFACGDLSPP